LVLAETAISPHGLEQTFTCNFEVYIHLSSATTRFDATAAIDDHFRVDDTEGSALDVGELLLELLVFCQGSEDEGLADEWRFVGSTEQEGVVAEEGMPCADFLYVFLI
jgi:hypothetical protein